MPQASLLLVQDWEITLIDHALNRKFLENIDASSAWQALKGAVVSFKAGSVLDLMYPVAENSFYVLRTCGGSRFVVTKAQKDSARVYGEGS